MAWLSIAFAEIAMHGFNSVSVNAGGRWRVASGSVSPLSISIPLPSSAVRSLCAETRYIRTISDQQAASRNKSPEGVTSPRDSTPSSLLIFHGGSVIRCSSTGFVDNLQRMIAVVACEVGAGKGKDHYNRSRNCHSATVDQDRCHHGTLVKGH
jgi:hypothetical protein